jgi:hypothetical protein
MARKTKQQILRNLDPFTRQYLETALWSSTDNADDSGGEPLDRNFDIEDFTRDALLQAVQDCKEFQENHGDLLCSDGQDFEKAGHDFWLTRNGHGAGFWDGDWPVNGDKLTEASEPYGEVYLYPYRGKVYAS